MDELETPTKFDLQYTESKIIFSICDCSLDKKYSFYNLSREEATKFLKRLQHIEKLTWGQFTSLSRKNGVTNEKPDSGNFDLIHGQNSSAKNLLSNIIFIFVLNKQGYSEFLDTNEINFSALRILIHVVESTIKKCLRMNGG